MFVGTRRAVSATALLLLVAACSGSGAGVEDGSTAAPPGTDAVDTTQPPDEASTTPAPTTSTAAPVAVPVVVITCDPGSGPDFSGQDLSGTDFEEETLRCAVFDRATLAGLSMGRSDATGASFRDAVLDEVSFDMTTLIGVDFGGARLDRVRFLGADLTGADLREAEVGDVRWDGATCPDGTLSDDAGGACDGNLEPASIEVDATDAAAAIAPIEFAPLCTPDSGDDFAGQELVSPDLRRRDLRCARFNGTTLEGAELSGVDVSGADFEGAIITESRFDHTPLFAADFTGAVLTRVQFVNANLIGADITETQFTETRWVNTVCPNGVNSDDAGGTCLGSRTALDLPEVDFDEITDGDITVREGSGLTTYTIGSDLLFDFDSDALTREAQAKLEQVIESIATRFAPDVEIQVWGHADAVGDPAYNLELSQRRADNVAAVLGAAAALDGYRIVPIGLGEAQPVAPNANPDGSDNPDGRAQNRRVEIVVRTG